MAAASRVRLAAGSQEEIVETVRNHVNQLLGATMAFWKSLSVFPEKSIIPDSAEIWATDAAATLLQAELPATNKQATEG